MPIVRYCPVPGWAYMRTPKFTVSFRGLRASNWKNCLRARLLVIGYRQKAPWRCWDGRNYEAVFLCMHVEKCTGPGGRARSLATRARQAKAKAAARL